VRRLLTHPLSHLNNPTQSLKQAERLVRGQAVLVQQREDLVNDSVLCFGEEAWLRKRRLEDFLHRVIITLRALDTKTKKPRQVPMTPQVRATLIELSKVRDIAHKHVFVYQRNPVGEVKTAFKTARRKAGIENLHFHDLRHCAATNLRRAGVDMTTAMQIIGHKSPLMWKRYNSVAETDLLTAANKLNTYLLNTVITPADSSEAVEVVSA
jgi:hypothetical protein